MSSDDENVDMCVAEWSWASKSKPFVCSALKPVSQKNWQEEMKFTFDVAKCDRIFDYLLQEKQIKLPNGHVIPSPEELKRSAYCKWHNSHSHATNDCNVFRRQVQSAINEGRLRFAESPKMQLDSNPFPVNVIDFENSKVLVRPSQAESTKNKAVIVSDGGMHTVKTPSSGSGQSSLPRMIKPRSPEIGRWKVNESRNKATKRVEKPKPTFKDLSAKYEGRAGKGVASRPNNFKRPRSPPMQGFEGPDRRWEDFHASPPYPPFGPPMPLPWGPPPVGFPPCPPWGWCGPWVPPAPMTYEPFHPMPYQPFHPVPYGPFHPVPFEPFHPGWEAPRRPVFDRLSWPRDDRSNQRNRSYDEKNGGLVNKVYRVKEGGDSGRNSSAVLAAKNDQSTSGNSHVSNKVISTAVATEQAQVNSAPTATVPAQMNRTAITAVPAEMNSSSAAVPAADCGGGSCGENVSVQPGKGKQLQWCPPDIGHTRKRRLQRLRAQELRESKAEKMREEIFNDINPEPMVRVRREWRAKQVAASVQENSDEEHDLLECGSPVIRDGSPLPERMDINMVFTLPSEFRVVDEEIAQLCLGPKDVIFEKPDESSRHMKPLYIKGHINGRPISRMLVDGGATVNLMPYSVFKKLGREDSELLKANLTLNGFTGEPTEAKDIISMELTIGSKTLPTAFFVTEVQGNYNVMLGRDWIHANHCVPSTLHQTLIQWVGDVEVVHADTSACVALADASVDWQYGNIQCLTGLDLSDYDYVIVTKDGFVPVSIKPASAARLSSVML